MDESLQDTSTSFTDTSRAASAIQDLNDVDKDIARLLQLASSSISLLTLPETDQASKEDGQPSLPQGEERSEQFVLEVSDYFQTLDTIQEKIREAIARVRQYRINPSVIDTHVSGSMPPTFGVGLPSSLPDPDDNASNSKSTPTTAKGSNINNRGLQETRVERDAWKNIYQLLVKMKEQREAKMEE